MVQHIPLVQGSSEESFAALIDSVRRKPELRDTLAEYLPENAAVYRTRGANATVRMRGYLFAVYEEVGLPPAALPYVLQELESGEHAYLVAGAAKALRGIDQPSEDLARFLLIALVNMRYMDDAVTFDEYRPKWPRASYTTALVEILKTIGWLGVLARPILPDLDELLLARAPMPPTAQKMLESVVEAMRRFEIAQAAYREGFGILDGPLSPTVFPISFWEDPFVPPTRTRDVTGIRFEDQNQKTITFAEYFSGLPTVTAFFYTRCNNPRKCSLTIAKLGKVQHRFRENGAASQIKTAAISYDPEYDLPFRLKAYGANRGFRFDEQNRFMRTTERFAELQEYFDLGVNYGSATVNHHRIELFIVDAKGKIAQAFTHLQWGIDEVCEKAISLAGH